MSWGAGSFRWDGILLQPTDHLSQLTARQEDAAPLDSAELDHADGLYQSLRSSPSRPGWALVLINISDELKRAKRLDQEERFYREAIAGPTRLGQIAGAFMLAADGATPTG